MHIETFAHLHIGAHIYTHFYYYHFVKILGKFKQSGEVHWPLKTRAHTCFYIIYYIYNCKESLYIQIYKYNFINVVLIVLFDI